MAVFLTHLTVLITLIMTQTQLPTLYPGHSNRTSSPPPPRSGGGGPPSPLPNTLLSHLKERLLWDKGGCHTPLTPGKVLGILPNNNFNPKPPLPLSNTSKCVARLSNAKAHCRMYPLPGGRWGKLPPPSSYNLTPTPEGRGQAPRPLPTGGREGDVVSTDTAAIPKVAVTYITAATGYRILDTGYRTQEYVGIHVGEKPEERTDKRVIAHGRRYPPPPQGHVQKWGLVHSINLDALSQGLRLLEAGGRFTRRKRKRVRLVQD